ncbi:MAG: DUF1326 domain-containing protein [Deltaproteobacteria bacterium]|nr:DUF1326 domain-containing protein [Deltaproteobacteria bacterium]
MDEKIPYYLKGVSLGGCSCDWGCPCNFEAPPTRGFCEGSAIWHVEQGHYGDVRLDGLRIGMSVHSPAALHLGNVTLLALVDDRADARQREAIEALFPTTPPFSIFYSLASTFLGFHYVPIEMQMEGIRSRVTIPETLELALAPMINPVTGEEEPATLLKPKGFTSQLQELCATAVLRFSKEGLSYDHSGKYGEFSPFEYKGA